VVLFTENQKLQRTSFERRGRPPLFERERSLLERGAWLPAVRAGRVRAMEEIARGGITSFLFQTPLQRSCPGELPTGRSDETTGEREWTKGASASFFLSFFFQPSRRSRLKKAIFNLEKAFFGLPLLDKRTPFQRATSEERFSLLPSCFPPSLCTFLLSREQAKGLIGVVKQKRDKRNPWE